MRDEAKRFRAMALMSAQCAVKPKTLIAIFVAECITCGMKEGQPCRGENGTSLTHRHRRTARRFLDVHKERRWLAESFSKTNSAEYNWFAVRAEGLWIARKNRQKTLGGEDEGDE